MKQPTFKQRFGYWFDKLMAKGTPAMIMILAFASFAIIFAAGLFIFIFGIHPPDEGQMSLGEAVWASLMRTLDPGTMGGDMGPGFRVVMLVVTIGGIFIVSALIGVLNSGLEEQLERLRKGRSRVLENGHTLILGWSPQVFTIISELMIANENQPNARIVLIANQDKVEMEEHDPRTYCCKGQHTGDRTLRKSHRSERPGTRQPAQRTLHYYPAAGKR